MNTLALGQGSFDLSRIGGRRRRWWRRWWGKTVWRKGSKTAPLHPEYFARPPHGYLDKDERKEERERSMTKNLRNRKG